MGGNDCVELMEQLEHKVGEKESKVTYEKGVSDELRKTR